MPTMVLGVSLFVIRSERLRRRAHHAPRALTNRHVAPHLRNSATFLGGDLGFPGGAIITGASSTSASAAWRAIRRAIYGMCASRYMLVLVYILANLVVDLTTVLDPRIRASDIIPAPTLLLARTRAGQDNHRLQTSAGH